MGVLGLRPLFRVAESGRCGDCLLFEEEERKMLNPLNDIPIDTESQHFEENLEILMSPDESRVYRSPELFLIGKASRLMRNDGSGNIRDYSSHYVWGS